MGVISSYGNKMDYWFILKINYSWITIASTLFMIILACVLIPSFTIIGGVLL
jgi:hypothetical protein